MLEEFIGVRAAAELLFTTAEVDAAIDDMARAMMNRLQDADPVLLTVMMGGIVPVGMLMPRLDFPLQVDYVQLTRYGSKTRGGTLNWVKKVPETVKDRVVVIVDDLLDEGLTLAAVIAECESIGAREVLTAVLLVKEIEARRGLQSVDFFGLNSPNRYLFGYGMDYKSYGRNAPGIFATCT